MTKIWRMRSGHNSFRNRQLKTLASSFKSPRLNYWYFNLSLNFIIGVIGLIVFCNHTLYISNTNYINLIRHRFQSCSVSMSFLSPTWTQYTHTHTNLHLLRFPVFVLFQHLSGNKPKFYVTHFSELPRNAREKSKSVNTLKEIVFFKNKSELSHKGILPQDEKVRRSR